MFTNRSCACAANLQDLLGAKTCETCVTNLEVKVALAKVIKGDQNNLPTAAMIFRPEENTNTYSQFRSPLLRTSWLWISHSLDAFIHIASQKAEYRLP